MRVRPPQVDAWDSVPPARFQNLDRVQPVLATLRRESAARIAEDPAFSALRHNLATINADLKAKSLSLNEADRRREKEQADALEASLKQAVQSSAAQTPPTYDITLKNVDTPGLPTVRKPTPIAKAETDKTPKNDDLKIEPGAGAVDSGADIVLREAENILADYIRAVESSTTHTVAAQR